MHASSDDDMSVTQRMLCEHIEQRIENRTEELLRQCMAKHELSGLQSHIGGELCVMDVDLLVHDHNKIRNINQSFVRDLLQGFIRQKHLTDLTPLIAVQTQDNQTCMVIDGNHRLAALKMYKAETVRLCKNVPVKVQVKRFPRSIQIDKLRDQCATINTTNDFVSGYTYLNYVSAYIDFAQDHLLQCDAGTYGYLSKALCSPAFKSRLPVLKSGKKSSFVKIATFVFQHDENLHIWRQLRHIMPLTNASRFIDVVNNYNFESEDKAMVAFAAMALADLPTPGQRDEVITRIMKADDETFVTQLYGFLAPSYPAKAFKPYRKRKLPPVVQRVNDQLIPTHIRTAAARAVRNSTGMPDH